MLFLLLQILIELLFIAQSRSGRREIRQARSVDLFLSDFWNMFDGNAAQELLPIRPRFVSHAGPFIGSLEERKLRERIKLLNLYLV